MSTDELQRTGLEPRTSVLIEISNAMVGLYKEQFGRGPTRARTHWCGDDVLTVILEETLTPAERNMVRMGEHQRLRDLRMSSNTRPSASSAKRSSTSPA
jgi:uncharacterized protein YbcI